MRIIDAQKWECVSSKQYSEACQKSYLPILVKMKNQGVRFYVRGELFRYCVYFQAWKKFCSQMAFAPRRSQKENMTKNALEILKRLPEIPAASGGETFSLPDFFVKWHRSKCVSSQVYTHWQTQSLEYSFKIFEKPL